MPPAIIRPDGLHIDVEATLQQLIADKELQLFADGMVVNAITEGVSVSYHTLTVAELLHIPSPVGHGFLTVLLALDAELNSVVDGETRVFPLTTFLNYRTRLRNVSIVTIRCLPLNKGGHYFFSVNEARNYLAIRVDIHPTMRVAGHVRIAIASDWRYPQRLRRVEDRLDRQVLSPSQIKTALTTDNLAQVVPPVTCEEQERLAALLSQLIND